jgi:hypothetical protein
MIDLYTIKLNNTYTYKKQSDIVTPVAGQTLLADVTDVNYTRGYSYVYSTQWDRTDSDKDTMIEEAIKPSISTILDYMNNHFYVKSDTSNSNITTFCKDYSTYIKKVHISSDELTYATDGTIGTFDNSDLFIVGDLIHIRDAKRNKNKYGYVIAKTDNNIQLDIALRAEDSYGLLMLSEINEQVELIIGKMIWFDIYERDLLQNGNITSESEGSYSQSTELDGSTINGLQYPSGITNGLNPYIRVRVLN